MTGKVVVYSEELLFQCSKLHEARKRPIVLGLIVGGMNSWTSFDKAALLVLGEFVVRVLEQKDIEPLNKDELGILINSASTFVKGVDVRFFLSPLEPDLKLLEGETGCRQIVSEVMYKEFSRRNRGARLSLLLV